MTAEVENTIRDLNIEIACAEYAGEKRVTVSVRLLKEAMNALNDLVEKTEAAKRCLE